MSFQLLLQLWFYNLLLHSQKRQTTLEGNLMPPPPTPLQLEKAKSDKLRFLILQNQFELFNNNYTTGKIILYLVKNLDSVVVRITHNYPSITKICCRPWKVKLSSLTTFTSKLCNKLSTQFKYLNSVISCITDH